MRPGFEGSQDYDLVLRATAATAPARIRHIPAILYHWRRGSREQPSFSDASLARCISASRRAIAEHLERAGIAGARVVPAPAHPIWNRVMFPIPTPAPLVSVIVPTRDRPELLARCADAMLWRTDYAPLELLLVDNDSQDPDALALLDRLATDSRVRVLRRPGPFNYSAMNNAAAEEARGQVLVLLNNDIDVIDSGWLTEMVAHAMRPDVGAVGAKLLYPDGRLQHGGIVLGPEGNMVHALRFAARNDIGYFGQLALTRTMSAVTGACLAVRREIFIHAGGFDEEHLHVAFNEVDLCLRIGALGYRNIWTPFAQMYHLESASRGHDDAPERRERWLRELAHMQRLWGMILEADPFHNPNLRFGFDFFELPSKPRRERPWCSVQKSAALGDTGAPAAERLARADILLAPVPRAGRIIEIGPSFSPIAPKAGGWEAYTLDHATREELTTKYRGHPGVDVSRIEEVDFIWTGGPLSDAVPAALHGTFDAFIASHVIEHTPDLVAFLDSAATLLKPDGVVVLAIPDKRYCFDYFQPLTTTGQLLAAHRERRSRHTPRLAFDHFAYTVEDGGAIAWGQRPIQGLRLIHTLEEAHQKFAAARPDGDYLDVHAWRFTPASFELLLLELAWLGETDWRIERTTPPEGCEFLVWLRRGGSAAARSLSSSQLSAQRLRLLKRSIIEARVQIDWLLAGEPDLMASTPALLPPGALDRPPAPATAEAARTTAPRFVDWLPTPQNAARAFEGEWSSAVPGLPTGQTPLFDDDRIVWFEERFGGFAKRKVLELGPLEGGHTYMMTQRGAEVLAIESNLRAWMRCLVAKEAVGMAGATFLLGDFVKYLNAEPPRFDFVLASGVLYHMTDPVGLLRSLTAITDVIGLWTHYFDPTILRAKENFDFVPRRLTTPRGRTVELYEQRYLRALEWAGFCGGSAPGSFWMSREGILKVLEDEGFVCETGFEHRDHPNGPAFCVFARRQPRFEPVAPRICS
jgi:GT2 family glycosyltransferase/2-polyprenyl-3-methyl-5-hydroxy-6-metoxy-1,4-benzoquinol methylase